MSNHHVECEYCGRDLPWGGGVCTCPEKRVAELEKENFALAANQCHDGYIGEHGDHQCRDVNNLIETSGKMMVRAETAEDHIIELKAEVERLRELAREHADLAANNRQEFLDAEAREQAFREVLEAVRPEIAFSWQKDLVKRIDTALATKESDSQKSHGFVYRGRPGLSPPSSPPKESPK